MFDRADSDGCGVDESAECGISYWNLNSGGLGIRHDAWRAIDLTSCGTLLFIDCKLCCALYELQPKLLIAIREFTWHASELVLLHFLASTSKPN